MGRAEVRLALWEAQSGGVVEHGLNRVMTEMQGDQSGWHLGPPGKMPGGEAAAGIERSRCFQELFQRQDHQILVTGRL